VIFFIVIFISSIFSFDSIMQFMHVDLGALVTSVLIIIFL